MAVSIRLKRFGKKEKPVYRVVVADARNQRDGKALEYIGFYNPVDNPVEFRIDEDRLTYWLGVGANPTKTVSRLISNKGLAEKKKIVSAQQGIAKKDRKKEEQK